MKKKLLLAFIGFIILLFALYQYLHYKPQEVIDPAKAVYLKTVDGKTQIIRNGKPFHIRGASGKSYVKELSEAGGNTLRVYDTINLQQLLDDAQKYNVAVIVDIPLARFNSYVNFYSDEAFKNNARIKIKSIVDKFKNHPALLIWNLGNELTYPLPINNDREDFINFFNELIDLIHEEDPNHLISTSMEGTFIKQSFKMNRFSPNIDLIGYNVFSMIGTVKSNERLLSYLTSTVPYYISEWGINGPWEAKKNKWMSIIEPSAQQKAETYKEIYNTFIKTDEQCLGSLAFYWGHKIEGTPTWFNVFDKKGRKSHAYYGLSEAWTDKKLDHMYPPKIRQLKLAGKSEDNLVFNVGDIIEAEILLEHTTNQKIEIKWMLFEDGWGSKGWEFDKVLNDNVFNNQILNIDRLKVSMPEKEGAYRLFANVYDEYNNFTSANIPFYILSTNE